MNFNNILAKSRAHALIIISIYIVQRLCYQITDMLPICYDRLKTSAQPQLKFGHKRDFDGNI